MSADEGSSTTKGWCPAPDVLVERMEDSALLINLTTNRMFELNPTGTRLWDLLVEGLDIDAIKARLLGDYLVEASTLDHEVQDLLTRLESEKLVVPDDGG
jgi:hypothetical protein